MTKTLVTTKSLNKEAGSFKDPDGFVFYAGDAVYRHINQDRQAFYEDILARPVVQKLIRESKLIETKYVELEGEKVLEHRKINFISYPYEWSLSQIIDAAIFTLDVQIELLNDNLCLKDATPFNVQYIGSKPIFIDFSSIESNSSRNIWLAYNQFLECFFYTIILKLERNISTKELFLANLDGIKVDQVKAILGSLKSYTQYPLEVGLPYLFRDQSKMAKQVAETSAIASVSQANIKSQQLTLGMARKKLQELRKQHLKALAKSDSVWSSYTEGIHYGDSAYAAKQTIIKEILEIAKPQQLIDLGCNEGDFSFIAHGAGAKVVSVDLDHDCVDRLYQRCLVENPDITPICLDLSNPSPSMGWNNKERKSVLERLSKDVKADMVFALALMHHLLISSRVPLDEIVRFLASLTTKYLVVEFVGHEDEMFLKTLGTRENIYKHVTDTNFEKLLNEHFQIVKVYSETNNRKIYLLQLLGD